MANNFLQGFSGMQDALSTADTNSRKTAAYKALRNAYGDIAGEPEQALELQSYGARQNSIPVAQEQAETNLANTKANAPLIQRQEAAKAGEAEETTTDKANTRQGKAIYNGANFIQSAIARGEDPLQAYDKVAPLMQLPPDKAAAVRAAIEKNPAVVQDFIKAYGPQATGAQQRFQVVQSPDGTLHRVTATGAEAINDASGNPIKAYQAPQAAERIDQGDRRLTQQYGLAQPGFKGDVAAAVATGKERGKIAAEDLPQSNVGAIKSQQQIDSTKQSFDVANDAIEKATKDTGWLSAGPLSHLPDFANPASANLRGELNTVQSKVVLDTITEMKNLSKTGSTGFGQLSDREGQLISSRLGAVLQASTPKRLKSALSDLQGQLKISRDRVLGAYEAEQKIKSPKKPAATNGGRVEGDNVILKWNPATGRLE